MPSRFDVQVAAVDQSIQEFAAQIQSKIKTSRLNATDYNTPYFTGAIIDGREMWGAILDFGTLPNTTTKALLIPSNIVGEWSMVGERWIDTGNSFVFQTSTGLTLPLPHTSSVTWKKKGQSTTDQIAIWMNDAEIMVATESDRTDFKAIITLKYLKVPVT